MPDKVTSITLHPLFNTNRNRNSVRAKATLGEHASCPYPGSDCAEPCETCNVVPLRRIVKDIGGVCPTRIREARIS